MKKLLLFTFLLIITLGQTLAQRFDYEKNSKLFFGLNIGSVWHTSDVENAKDRFPLGAGFVFGGSINQNYGNAISFDLRFRYLGGTWYGKDSDTTSAIHNNYAVNQFYDTLGYTVQNFRAAQHRFALELSVHANRFKERTGIDPYIFGGIGFTASHINGDLLNKNSTTGDFSTYPYNTTPNGSIIDEKYETPLDMNADGESYTANAFDVKVLPSLGVGIGYYFNDRFSMGLEHKTTFFMDDYFDGTIVNQEGAESRVFKNDLYHYTSVYFKWYLRKRKTRTWEPPVQDNKNTPVTEPVRRDKPIVDFTNPSNSPHRTNSPVFHLMANIKNVNSAQNVTFTNNQQKNTDFYFNPETEKFEANVQLVPGLNTFFLKGENHYGKARDLVEIYYDQARVQPPVVNITDPSDNPHYTNSLSHNALATIKNVSARNQVKVELNGESVNNFSFNPTGNNNLSVFLKLKAGTNTLTIQGKNNYGSDFDQTQIIYRRSTPDEGNPPSVEILTPSISPYTTQQSYENVVAKIKNVETKQNVSVKVNGNITTNFAFNRNGSYASVELNAVLKTGINTVRITANNPYGNDFDETQIIYRKATPDKNYPPTVEILTPSADPYTTMQEEQNVVAKVEHVTQKSQIQVRVNGSFINNFSFNNNTKRVQFNADLTAGTNTVRITANNPYGNDFDETQIIYRKATPDKNYPPTVEILTPSADPYTTMQENQNVVAKVEHVTQKSQIQVRVNGSFINNFSFNNNTKRVQFNADLTAGTNTVRITVNNPYGNDFDETQIIYRKATVVKPPYVNFIKPNSAQKDVTDEDYLMIAKVTNIDSKSNIEVFFNGQQLNANDYSFNPQSGLVKYNSQLKLGTNTYVIKVSNSAGKDQASQLLKRVTKKVDTGIGNEGIEDIPCDSPEINMIAPKSTTTNIDENDGFNVYAKLSNITDANNIEIKINGRVVQGYGYNSKTGAFNHQTKFEDENNVYVITLTNKCGSTTQTLYFNRTPEETCGVQFEMLNRNTEFCITTKKGTFKSSNLLSNAKFSYQGAASSVYFKATRNGKAMVNGKAFNLIKGNYYHFIGILTVEVSKNRPGNKGKWSICVNSQRPPLYGKGRSKPTNPCVLPKRNEPEIQPKPNVRNKPDQREKPEIRKSPNKKGEPNRRTSPNRGESRNTPNIRNGRR